MSKGVAVAIRCVAGTAARTMQHAITGNKRIDCQADQPASIMPRGRSMSHSGKKRTDQHN
jgi:hypothetical protein